MRLCRFPGSQPVSFGVKDLAKLESQEYVFSSEKSAARLTTRSYWVCEKSDGIRVLFLIATNVETLEQDAYLVRCSVVRVLCAQPRARLTDTTLTEGSKASSFPTTRRRRDHFGVL